MKKFYLIILFLLNLSAHAQQWTWGIPLNGQYSSHFGEDLAGNKYIASGISNNPDATQLLKLDSSGNQVWSHTIACRVLDLVVKNNALFFCGYFADTAQFDNTTLITTGNFDGFVARYDLAGNLDWIKQATGPSAAYVGSLSVNAVYDVFVSSVNDSTTMFGGAVFDKGVSVCVFNSSGSLTNSFQVNQNQTFFGHNEIKADDFDNIYLLGAYNDSTMMIDTITLHASDTYYGTYFLAKFTRNGNVYWAENYNGVFRRQVGNLTVTGIGTLYLTTGTDYSGANMTKLATSGYGIWSYPFGGGTYDDANDLKLDAQENIYLTGSFWYNTSFSGGCSLSGNQFVTYAASLDSSGNCLWSLMGQSPNPSAGLELAVQPTYVTVLGYDQDSATIQLGNIYITGSEFLAKISLGTSLNTTQLEPSDNISLYPNPATGTFAINCPLSIVNSQLKIYNSFGQLIHQQIITSANQQIDLSKEPKGIYIVEVGNERRKIVLD